MFQSWFGAGYTATDPRRKIIDPRVYWQTNRTTANQLLTGSHAALRTYCRHLERNNATARAAVEGLSGLIVGSGIALEPDTGDDDTNKRIRDAWVEYIQHIDVEGRDLYTLQSEACRDMIVAGEAIWRFVVDEDVSAPGDIPLRVIALESEWLAPIVPEGAGVTWSMGIQLDKFGRAVNYWLQNPLTNAGEVVPAKNIAHIFERRRSMQARGEPWMSPIIETLMNERDLVDAELYAAKQTAALAIAITSQQHDGLDTTEIGDDADPVQALRIGSVVRLFPGEDIKAVGHTRPAQGIAPFRQMLRGDIAASLRLPQRFLDRDVSRANYSSMRADMLDTERLLQPVREWFGHATAGRVYQRALPYLALRAGVKPPRAGYRLVPDGQPYVDPLKDAQAAVESIAGGLSTFEQEIGKRGGDYRKVWEQLARERAEAAALGIPIPTTQDAANGSAETKASGVTADGGVNINNNADAESAANK